MKFAVQMTFPLGIEIVVLAVLVSLIVEFVQLQLPKVYPVEGVAETVAWLILEMVGWLLLALPPVPAFTVME